MGTGEEQKGGKQYRNRISANIEVSYSHLYQEMQQAVYDSETFARVDSDSDIYTYNRSIMAVKEYFQQLGISYGTDLS